MAFNTKAVAEQLVTIISGLSAMSHATVQIGAPLSIGPRLGAYVTMGAQRPNLYTQGQVKGETHIFVDFVYRLDNDETTAETTLMDALDQFTAAIFADLTLGGTVSATDIETGLSDEPDYRARAGKEFREYPVVLTVTQYGSYDTNP